MELPPELAAEMERAAERAVARMVAEREAARSALRSVIESRWREEQPPGSAVQSPSHARVRIGIEAEGLSREEFAAIHRRVRAVFRESAAQPAADRLQLTEVNLKDAYVALVDPVRQRKYVVGFKLLKRAFEGALIIGVFDMLGADEVVDRLLTCNEEDIDAAGQVCEFITVITGTVDLAWWDSIGSEIVPTEVVLDRMEGRVPAQSEGDPE